MIIAGFYALALACAAIALWRRDTAGATQCVLFALSLFVWVGFLRDSPQPVAHMMGATFWLCVAALSLVVNKSPNGGKSLFPIYLAAGAACYFPQDIFGFALGTSNPWARLSDVFGVLAVLEGGGLRTRGVFVNLGRKVCNLGLDYRRRNRGLFLVVGSKQGSEKAPKVGGS